MPLAELIHPAIIPIPAALPGIYHGREASLTLFLRGALLYAMTRPSARLCLTLACVLAPLAAARPAEAQIQPAIQWRAIGPWGGDARAFAGVPGEPQHLFLGGTDNWVFQSTDGGATWTRI